MSLAAGDYLVVFASSKDRTNPASELHTNFKLSSDGEYLALVEPGGTQVAFAFDPIYPAQQEDISYGFAGDSAAVILLEEVQPCLTLVPSDGSLGTNWVARTFDDGSWAEGMTGMGYERSSGYQGLIGSDLNAQMYNIRSTAYMRVPVVVGNPEDVAELELKIKFDDGFIAYINGQPVASSAAPATPVWDSEAIFRRPSDDMALSFTPFAISNPENLLVVPFDPTNAVALSAFESVYGLAHGGAAIQGPFNGKRSNRTGRIALERPQAPDVSGQAISWVIVDEVFYADAAPWPIDPDGIGLALHRSNTLASGNDPSAWREGLPSPTSATIALADTDGDGITDQWEFDHSGSITGVVASAQTGDGDGFSYLDEYLLDFNPGVSNAPFSIQGIGADPSVQIIFGATSAQRSYTIEYSTNLISGFGWKLLQTGVPGSDGTTLFSDPATNAVRYYRVRVP